MAAGAGGTAMALQASSPSHAASVPTAGQTQAVLEVRSGTPVLDIGVAPLNGALLQVSTPDSAPVRPVLAGTKLITLSLVGTAPASGHGGSSGYAVRVVLNSAVTWTINLAGGSQQTNVDLRGGKVGGIAETAGCDILDVSLPSPAGTVPFLLAGGASQFLLSLPSGVPAQVAAGGGAGYLSLDGQNLTGVAGGTVLTNPGWATATSRFAINATAGVSRLTVTRWSAPSPPNHGS
jgi:hypothetical protein